MKKFIGTLVGAVLLFLACSPDVENHHPLQEDGSVSHLERLPLSPGNGDNPYDHRGRMYREALLLYLNAPAVATSKGPGAETGDSGTWQDLTSLLADSGLGTGAQASLLGFIETLLALQPEGYAVLYDTLVDFETGVMGCPEFTGLDKQVLLSFASLVRHAAYPSENVRTPPEVEDEDWDLSVANFMTMVQLALEPTHDEDTGSFVSSPDTGPLGQGQ